jgi:hypothetical protein
LRSRTALEGERKQITVLFADLKSSMELLADRDLDEHEEFMARDNLEAARCLYDAIAQAFEDLAAMPELGSPLAFQNLSLSELLL